ncbi:MULTISPECIES: DUF1189 family protein [Clostridium]|uniref:DUF1189 family protein n=1 Tax=Clostridium cibarium TaxID=2762247 RepID=A0ABR8PRV7_9CLOT|nr:MULTISPECIES: DUF1189 family protein [Clostridium]MBD7910855.1 DUF1189 family protein [Clostridium cibarium]
MTKGDNIFKKIINSIYNLKEFPSYRKEGIKKAILYALILTIFIGGIKGIIKSIGFNNSSNETIRIISDEKYKFSIVNGQLNLVNTPLKIEENNMIIYMDKDITISESAKLSNSTIVNEGTYILMLNDGIVVNSNNSGISQMKYNYNELGIMNGFDNKTLIDMIRNIKLPIMVLIAIVYIIQEFIFYLMVALMIGVLSLIPSKLFKLNMELEELFSLAIYTATFPNILILILTILVPNVPFDTAGMVGTIIFTYIILNDLRKEINL